MTVQEKLERIGSTVLTLLDGSEEWLQFDVASEVGEWCFDLCKQGDAFVRLLEDADLEPVVGAIADQCSIWLHS